MTKGLINLFLKDLVIAFRNALFWVLIVTLILMIVSIKFLIPDTQEADGYRYFYDKSEARILETVLIQSGLEEKYMLSSVKDVEDRVSESPQSVGIIFEGGLQNPKFTIIHQGEVNRYQKKMIDVSLEMLIANMTGVNRQEGYEVEYLRPQSAPVSGKLAAIPSLLAFEVLILGFMFIAVFMFQEKEEGSIRAYRISPGSTSMYILSKTLVFLVIGLIYGFALVLLTVGPSVNFLMLGLIIVLGSVLYSFLGAIVAVFFNNISEWFVVGTGLLMLNMAPVLSHLYPTFSPKFITLIPSYSILFIFNEIIFPTGKNITPWITTLSIITAIAFVICYMLVDRRLMKEGH